MASVINFTIATEAEKSPDFRRVLWTGEHTQLVIMTIPPGGEIGEEVHEDTDQILTFVSGTGEATVSGHEEGGRPGRPRRRPGRQEAQLRQHRPEPADPLHGLRPAGARRRRGAHDQGGGRPARGRGQGRAADQLSPAGGGGSSDVGAGTGDSAHDLRTDPPRAGRSCSRARARGCPAPGRAGRRRRLRASPGRCTPPTPRSTGCCPRAVVRPRHVDEIAAGARGLPRARGAADRARRRHVDRRQRRRPGRRDRHQPAPDRGCSTIDAEARTATVEPGRRAGGAAARPRRHGGLRFGPDPCTHNRCTIGGMIGNNACGSRALAYGRTSDNVVGLDVVTGAGERLRLGDGAVPAAWRRSPHLRGRWSAATWRRSAPSSAGSAARCPATRWSTCCPSTASTWPGRWSAARARSRSCSGATVRLVADAPHRGAGRARLPDMADAADATPGLLPHSPTAVEGLDARIVAAAARRRRPPPCPDLPAGRRLADRRADRRHRRRGRGEAARRARRRRRAGLAGGRPTRPRRRAIWRIREDGAGLAARTGDGRPAHAGWEDAAVPPERLGAYLREFDALLASTGCRASRTGTSATAACTCGSTSRSAPASGTRPVATGPSSRTPPGWSPATAGRCPASTATAGRAASCCRSCTPPPSSTLFAAVKARVRPGRRAQPRRAGRARRRSTPTSGWPPRPPRRERPGAGLPRTTAATSPRPCTAAPASASAGPTCRRRRRHVPVLPGHPRGEGLHPRPGPGAAGDARARRRR